MTASVALAATGLRHVKRLGGVDASLGGHNELELNSYDLGVDTEI